jgi:hypothetical protein
MLRKILHLAEVSAVGTAIAVESFSRNAPQYEHHVTSPGLAGKLTRKYSTLS